MSLLKLLFYLLVIVSTALCDNDTVKCEPGEEEDCSKCYKVLASSVVYSDRNMFQVQNTFFPPEEESPVFVIVKYEYKDEANGTSYHETWFWSTSTFYIFQPLDTFQFTSLFFSDTQLLTSNVTLTLPLDCYNASKDYKTMLTQRLKVYATRQSISSPIDDGYSPKAINVSTLKEWHSNHGQYSGFIVANFVLFPLMSWGFLSLLFIYINHFDSDSRSDQIKVVFKRKHTHKKFAYVFCLQDELILSFVFVVLVFCLSLTALIKASYIESELSKYFDITSNVQGFKNMYSLVITTFLSDSVILIAFGGSFGIFICKSLRQLCKSPNDFQYNPLGVEVPWKYLLTFCMYSTLFPLCCLANHLNYIIIAFIHDLYHATSVAIVYGVIIIFLSIMLNRLPYVFFKKWMEDMTGKLMLTILVVKVVVVMVLLSYVTIDIIVYFFIPIERAFEDAANHFISVYSTTVVFFTGLVAFFFIRKSFRSQIHIFTKAVDDFFHNNNNNNDNDNDNDDNNNNNNNNILGIRSDDWKLLGTDEKDVEVAKNLLMKIN